MAEVSYFQPYDKYTIAVIPIKDGTFDVQFMIKDQKRSILIESCRSELHAVKGAKQFPLYYEIALSEGFQITKIDFRHADGREINLTYAMDLDMTPQMFKLILDRGH